MPKDLEKKTKGLFEERIKVPFEEVFGKQKPSNPDEIIDVIIGYDFRWGHFQPIIKKMTRQEEADMNYRQELKDRKALREWLIKKRKREEYWAKHPDKTTYKSIA